MPDYYIYCADMYCEACTKAIKDEHARLGTVPDDPDDETSYDSDEYPKGPFSDEESDTPQHCGNGKDCLDPTEIGGEKYGQFFENPLTSEGENYVKECGDGPAKEFWLEHYGLRPDRDRCPGCDEVICECEDD